MIQMPDRDVLLKTFSYDPETGILSRRVSGTGRAKAGREAGSVGYLGYRVVMYEWKNYYVHRIIWLMQTGDVPRNVDHINRVKNDNRWSNLRDVAHQENIQNASRPKRDLPLGVTRYETKKKGIRFRATIVSKTKLIKLGLFETPELAGEAYEEARKIHHPYWSSSHDEKNQN